ncbi:hypothetical protein EYR40_010036 [Pleurotus pulmonarius]|nr:hypothetical protein EYR36_010566 [Pleurotus pulmonarius]KAF4588485.1 hypothetical protein EYR40_010036 [Pleurotus pulmonarius]
MDMVDALEVARTIQVVASHLELTGDMENCATEAECHAYVEMLEEGDIAVKVMSKKTTDELCTLLSFHGSRPGQWNTFLCNDGATAWHLRLTPSNPVVTRCKPSNTIINITLDMFQNRGYGFKPMSLLWHQLVGIAAIVAQMWYGQRVTSAQMSGILLADGVGVGKTAQVITTIAFIQQVKLIEQVTVVAQKLILGTGNMLWFMGTLEKVPNEPHLIIVPLSLVGHWKDELYCFFSRGAVDIFQIPNALNEIEFFFTDPQGTWKQLKQKMINCIVVCVHSTMSVKVFDMKTLRGTFVDAEHPFKKHTRYKFIFEMMWCSSWIDEAHLFHGQGLHVLTATPLFTKIQDIINVASLMNHDKFVQAQDDPGGEDAVKSRNLWVLHGQADNNDDDSGIAVCHHEMKNLNLIVDEMELTEGGVPADLSLENFWLMY